VSRGRDPWANDAADRERDLVFVSYNHCDAEWVQRFKVLLSPLLRTKRLQLWIDTDIRTGDAWHPDILDAIKRSAAALILVSADFLD
jgi:TIR domain